MGASISPFVIEVTKGDKISMAIASGDSGNIEYLGAYLTVEVVE